jgi:hypothetical protein
VTSEKKRVFRQPDALAVREAVARIVMPPDLLQPRIIGTVICAGPALKLLGGAVRIHLTQTSRSNSTLDSLRTPSQRDDLVRYQQYLVGHCDVA